MESQAISHVPFILSGKYFKINKKDGDRIEAICQNCATKNVYKGLITSTGNFHTHLKRVHPDLLNQFEKDQKEQGPVFKKVRKQDKNTPSLLGTYVVPDPDKSMTAFDRRIVKFIVNGMHSLDIVEEPDFIALFPDRKVLSRDTYRRRIEIAAAEVSRGIQLKLSSVDHVCLTCDLWTCGGMSRSFMGITAHWIFTDHKIIERKSVALACRRFEGSHTYDRIAEFLHDIMKEYELPIDKVVKVITDNATNFSKAFLEYGLVELNEESEADFEELSDVLTTNEEKLIVLPAHAKCASHTLSLVCTSDIPKITSLRVQQTSFAKCYGVWNKLSRSTQASENVKKITTKSLKTPVKTRWNSLYDSLNSLLEFRENLPKICDATNTAAFTEVEIKFLESYCVCVKPIAEALDRLQGENNTYYGELVPTILSTKNKLERILNNPPENSGKLAEGILKGFSKRFKAIIDLSIEHQDAIIAAVSHPLFKLRWVPLDKLEFIKELFIGAVISMQSTGIDLETVENKVETNSDAAESFFCFNDSERANIQNESSETTARQEALAYFLNKNKGLEILHQYPLVKKVFIKYNTALPSSAPVERLFSYSNMILCPKRRRLTDKLFETLTLLKVNGF